MWIKIYLKNKKPAADNLQMTTIALQMKYTRGKT